MKYRPRKVHQAVVSLDYSAAGAMSRSGGRVTAKIRRADKRLREIWTQIEAVKQQDEMYDQAVEAGEDVCPVDPDD